ncbi:putative F-box/LRR-repeat protein At3g44810 [Cicer arietinum]|uniref:F-box/FBD/LRR-repeat protein At1g13570-like n=1 Tax=Cicer arietinum TaxID=3827 RepID=A0A1S2XV13_CICAR|nr:F-box/FBD/LRR-repeat protein At1g13570-like [Cicer arietinum]
MDYISKLPDCILSYILTMLSMKDLLKTTILSKRWCKLWGLRRDLYFDVFNVFGTQNQLLHIIDMDMSRDEFVTRVHQFLNNFHGTKIDSFLVNFFLKREQSSTINQWLSFAIARGVQRIDLLLLGLPYGNDNTRCKLYKFDFALFAYTNASTLYHLSLQHCVVFHPINSDFILPFKCLRYLSLRSAKVDKMFIECLLSNCLLLEEFYLLYCVLKSLKLKIVSSSLRHLKVIGCYTVSHIILGIQDVKKQDDVKLILLDCPKLTSLAYDAHDLDTMKINTPMLNSIQFSISFKRDLNAFVAICATFTQLEIMHLTTLAMVTTSLPITQPLKHLKELNLDVSVPSYILNDEEYDPLWILNILQASPLLHKLSVMFVYQEFFEDQKDIRDVETFCHENVKVIELGGCVGNWFEIEFVMNVLKSAHKLERIVLSPYWREDEELDWNSNPDWFQRGRDRIIEKFQGEEVVGREKLVLI